MVSPNQDSGIARGENKGNLVTFARGELLRRIRGAQERVWLASPFLTAPIANHIVKAVDRSGAKERRLLTALVGGSVRVRALDPKALLILREAGFEIASIRNLHAKVSIVDSRWGLIGSGNLTSAGLGSTERGNAELGVVLDAAQIGEAAAIFAGWWAKADSVSRGRIEEFDALPRVERHEGEVEDFGPAVEPAQTAELDEILAEDDAVANSHRYWVKSAYHQPDDEDWWHRGWISDALLPKYEKGDLIVIYLGARNNGPKSCPAVVRAASDPRRDRDWVISHRDPEAADQWPFVTETVFVADVPVTQGVPLELIGKNGHSVQRGNCSITRKEFEIVASAMARLGQTNS